MNLFNLAESTKILCDDYSAKYIINDNVYLSKKMNADGVHLGFDGMNIEEARTILGKSKIIGGTANTFEHVLQKLLKTAITSVWGHFRFTTTKEKLSPFWVWKAIVRLSNK